MSTPDRRRFLVHTGAAAGALALLGIRPDTLLAAPLKPFRKLAADLSHFPKQDPDMVRECVSASHGRFETVRNLVDAHPALAAASHDWGFGDWETPLGAASHVGDVEIAQYLLSKGARINLFAATMLGQLEVVQAFVTANPGVQRTTGPHGITLYNHAKAGGERAAPVLKYLDTLGDANPSLPVQPLDPSHMAGLIGAYQYGLLPTDRIEITESRQLLQFTRGAGGARNLFHLGAMTFRPVGAPSVRIRFTMRGDRAESLTVVDHEPVLTAQRVSG